MLAKNTKWQKGLSLLFVLLVVGFAAHTGHLLYSRLKAHEMRVGLPIPYTVVLKETSYRPDGTAMDAPESTWAFRSDGSKVRRIAEQGSNPGSERTIQFASGEEIAINELTNIKSTMAMKGVTPARWQRDPASKCINSFAGDRMTSLQEVVSGEETVSGYRTVKITSGNITSWFALDYGCATVKDRADWGSQGYSEHNLVALVPGEPEAALFQVPESAREAPPSERLMSSEKDGYSKCGVKCREHLQKFDALYYSNKPSQK